MSKLLPINKNQFTVLITLLILIFLGASYFLIYLPNNEKNVQERRFRCLQNIDSNIHSKIENSVPLITNLLTHFDVNHTNKYIKDYPKSNFTLLTTYQSVGYIPNAKQIITPGDTSGNIVKINIDPGSQLILLANNPKNPSITIGMRFGFGQFIKPLLPPPPDVFDHYIIFLNDKKLYESFPSGLSYKDPDSLLEIKSKVRSPGIRSLKIGGTDYKVFSQPVDMGGDNKWLILGLVSNSHYQKEKNQLPLWIVLFLMTSAITMLVALPWIKLYHMGNKDKLTVKDGIASIVVAMMLMSLLFFVFFKYNFSLSSRRFAYAFNKHPKNVKAPEDSIKEYPENTFPKDAFSRNVLASKMINAFEDELDTAYKLLDKFDSMNSIGKAQDVSALGKGLTSYDALFRVACNHLEVHQIYWLDKKGAEMTNMTTVSDNAPKGNYSGRDYFKHAVQKQWNRTGPHSLYLDQLVSRTTGVFTSVISMPSRADSGRYVAAMTFTAKSVDSVIMPDGYQFAVIDNRGRVLYHYLPNRNLNENLKNELSDSTMLVSSIEAKSDTSFKAEYYGRQYNVKIKPFPDLPYFMVIFEDLEYNDTRDTEAYTFTLSMLFCLLIFLGIKFGIIFFVSAKRSFFKKQHYDTSWIGPKISSHHEYNLAIVANFVVIVLLIIFFSLNSFLRYLYILLFSIVLVSIFLNVVFAVNYKRSRRELHKYKIIAVYWLCAFAVVIDIAAYATLKSNNFQSLILYEAILIVVYFILFYAGPVLLVKVRKYKLWLSFPWTYTHSYAVMATTRLIISSGIPVAFFFVYSFNYEQNLDTRYRQLNFGRELTQKIGYTGVARTDSEENNRFNAGIYSDGMFVDSIKVVSIDSIRKQDSVRRLALSPENLLTIQILSAFRFLGSGIEIKNNNLNLPQVDNTAFFNNIARENGGNRISTRTYYQVSPDEYIKISSSHINYPYPNIFFWLLLIGFIVIYYYVIHNIIRKMFALNLPSTDGWKQIDEHLVTDQNLNRLLFILGSPGSGKLSKLKETIKNGKILGHSGVPAVIDDKDESKNNVFIVDMILIPVAGGLNNGEWDKCREDALKDHSLVIINHFEYNIQDAGTNSIKLDLLESLMYKATSKVMIISTVHPVSFLDSLSQDQLNPIAESELGRWHVLLGHFHVVIEPLMKADSPEANDALQKAIMEETQYTHFLSKMQPLALNILDEKNTEQTADSLIFKLQLTSQYFYTYIWQSLVREEKFLLYDLAEDGLVNPYDDFNLSMLICKGLVVKCNGTLVLFNRGFRNFILTAIGEKEVNRIKEQVKDNGKWGNMKTPMNLAILAILVFLFASQQEAYSRVITYITAFGAAIPAVLKIFSIFGGNDPKKAA